MGVLDALREKPTVESVCRCYETGVSFNQQLDLYNTVQKNENFFVGKQWEGVEANGLPTPVFNFLKRVVLFQVATITSDNISMQASPMASTSRHDLYDVDQVADIINKQFQSIFERNQLVGLLREYMRNAAVDGDGCLYTWFDPSVENGQPVKGEIVTEVLENSRVHFGNPNSRDVQTQPYILLARRMCLSDAWKLAAANGLSEERLEEIQADNSDTVENQYDAMNDGRVTVFTYLYKAQSEETDGGETIWKYVCTRTVEIQKPTDTGLTLYPIVWLNWDYIQDNYHGQSMISGLIPNQIFINKLFAMSQISLMTTAYPKIVYDKTRVRKWDSRVGAAIGVNGGDMNSVARIIDPAQISPQISEFIQLTVNLTQSFLGASDVALGDTRPDNTSAIVALQRASNVPMELTKQNLYKSVETLGRIYIDHMRNYYGIRYVQIRMNVNRGSPGGQMPLGIQLGQPPEFNQPFDFSILEQIPVSIQLDVGASSYWSEIAVQQTLDNLLMQGKIELVDYLERIPNGYITKKQELIETLKARQAMVMGQQAVATPAPVLGNNEKLPIPTGSGYGELQRAVNETGVV